MDHAIKFWLHHVAGKLHGRQPHKVLRPFLIRAQEIVRLDHRHVELAEKIPVVLTADRQPHLEGIDDGI